MQSFVSLEGCFSLLHIAVLVASCSQQSNGGKDKDSVHRDVEGLCFLMWLP
jgi:hypothetical protein